MARRSATPDLTRLLDALDEPMYVVDGERRLVFVNKACAAWTGCDAADLIGRECRYAADVGDDRPAATADALCPPPTAIAGGRATVEIVLPPRDETPAIIRLAEFTPLGGAAVLVRLIPLDVAAREAEATRRGREESQRLHAAVAQLRREAAAWYAPERLLGESPAMRRVRKQVMLAAKSEAATTIVGPAGIGKQHTARTIHALRGSAEPLVSCDGPTLDVGQLRTSLRSAARPATVLVTDVERIPPDVLSDFAGLLKSTDAAVRWIVTARDDLVRLAEAKKFPVDVAALLTTLVIEIPPLAKRPEDIPPLAQHLVEHANRRGTKQLGGFTTDAFDRLLQYAWPGQTAELADVVAQSCAKAEGALITVRDLPARLLLAADAVRYAARPEETIVLDDYLAEIEKELLRRAMQRAKGNKTKAAQLLGVTRPRLYRRLVQLGLEEGPVVFEEPADADEPTT